MLNISFLKILFIGVFFIVVTDGLNCQPINNNQRYISVNNPDSMVKTSYWNNNLKKEIYPDFMYYWYYAGKINHNLGGFSGKLLHGKYEVFDSEQKLKIQGFFSYGIKQGTWISWYPNGNVKSNSIYKNGLLHGKVKVYDFNGNLSCIYSYKNGLLHGKSVYNINGKLVERRYINGIEQKPHKKYSLFHFKKSNKTKKNIAPANPSEGKNASIANPKESKLKHVMSLFKFKKRANKNDLKTENAKSDKK